MKLLGPVFWYDLLRSSRRGRHLLLRCLYALFLLFLIWMVYRSLFPAAYAASVSYDRLAKFAEIVFVWYLLIQFLLVLLLTPAYVGGAIAEERQRRTLEFIFTTELLNREIVLGKFASRLLHLTLFILTGLPILSMLQLFGGVSPDLLWCGFAATGLTMLSLAGLSMLNSVYARNARNAILTTYLWIIGYFALYGVLLILQVSFLRAGPTNLLERGFLAFKEWYDAGNVFHALYLVAAKVNATGSFGSVLGETLGRYAVFHGAITVATVAWSIVRLRTVFAKQAFTAVKLPAKGAARRVARRPPIGNHPMIWKEVHHEARLRLGIGGQIALIFFGICCLLPAAFLVLYAVLDKGATLQWSDFRQAMNGYAAATGVTLSCLLLLAVGIRAAGSIGMERDRQTLDSLLASPLTTGEILVGKWLGSIAGMKWFALLLAIVWLVGIVGGGMSVFAIPVLTTCLAVYVAFFSALGLFFAAAARTTMRAMIWTVVLSVFLGGGHWFTCALPLEILSLGPRNPRWLADFFVGLTPPATLFLSSFGVLDWGLRGDALVSFVTFTIVGLALFGLGAAALGILAFKRFGNTCGRITLRAPRKPIDAPARMST